MRLFVAIPLPEAARGGLGALADALCRDMARGKPVPSENLHLTLHFLGEADPDAAARAVRAVGFSRFDLEFTHIGRFRQRDGDVIWAGVGEEPALARLHAELAAALRREGFAPDARPFRPHLTLARRAGPVGRGLDGAARAHLPVRMAVVRVLLLRTEFVPGGVRYHEVCARRADPGP